MGTGPAETWVVSWRMQLGLWEGARHRKTEPRRQWESWATSPTERWWVSWTESCDSVRGAVGSKPGRWMGTGGLAAESDRMGMWGPLLGA